MVIWPMDRQIPLAAVTGRPLCQVAGYITCLPQVPSTASQLSFSESKRVGQCASQQPEMEDDQ